MKPASSNRWIKNSSRQSVSRKFGTAVALFLITQSLTGCANLRSFFEMSSDSPVPFFGFDLKLPPKFSAVDPPRDESLQQAALGTENSRTSDDRAEKTAEASAGASIPPDANEQLSQSLLLTQASQNVSTPPAY